MSSLDAPVVIIMPCHADLPIADLRHLYFFNESFKFCLSRDMIVVLHRMNAELELSETDEAVIQICDKLFEPSPFSGEKYDRYLRDKFWRSL